EPPRVPHPGRDAEVADHLYGYAGHRGDLLDGLEALDRLDLADHHRVAVRRAHRGDGVAAAVVVVRDAERGATAAVGRVLCPVDEPRGGLGRGHHRRHDPARPDVEGAA